LSFLTLFEYRLSTADEITSRRTSISNVNTNNNAIQLTNEHILSTPQPMQSPTVEDSDHEMNTIQDHEHEHEHEHEHVQESICKRRQSRATSITNKVNRFIRIQLSLFEFISIDVVMLIEFFVLKKKTMHISSTISSESLLCLSCRLDYAS
jgi:hypothetical protein